MGWGVRCLIGRPRHPDPRKGLILLYHRVTRCPSDPQGLCVSPEHFTQHLEVLRRHATPMPLQAFVQAVHDRALPPRGVALTFDDGYADNFHHAKPLLVRYEVPATVFVATGHIGGHREFWWDELEQVLLESETLPEEWTLTLRGRHHRWRLRPRSETLPVSAHRAGQRWTVLEPRDPGPRERMYRQVHQLLRSLPEDERQPLMDALRKWSGVSPMARPTHRPLRSEEVIALAQGGLIEIGAHSVTHPVLSQLPGAIQAQEVQESQARLEQLLGWPICHFAYPYGTRADFSGITIRCLRDAGYHTACANMDGSVDRGTDPFRLPRLLIRDWNGDEFCRQLARCWGRRSFSNDGWI